MRNRFPTLSSVSLVALLCAVPVATAAADAVAKVENAGEALVFHPAIEAKALTLTVSGPCDYYSQRASERGEVIFKLDEETFDGSYSYSLVATPILDPEVRQELLKARETGDNRAVRRLCRDGKLPDAEKLTQTGSFTVLKGKIVFDPTPESARRNDRDSGE